MSKLRERVLELSKKHKLAHIGSNLSAVDIIAEIYEKLRVQDKFILSAGHAHLAHLIVRKEYFTPKYGCLDTQEFDLDYLLTQYGIHCDRRAGCEVSTGSLGNGLPIAVGMALADRTRRIYVLISDGECMEGSVWESLRLASGLNLQNLKVYCNANCYGGMGSINPLELEARLKAFFPVDFRYTNTEPLSGLEAHYQLL